MKSTLTTFTVRYFESMDAWWSLVTGTPPAAPAQDLPAKAAQAAADQEWEDEGGSIKPPKKPEQEPGPKIPF